MTLCVTWRDAKGLHMAADSRLSFGETRVDVAVKLLRIPCRIYTPWQGDTRQMLQEIDVAMLVAGNHETSIVTKESLEEVLSRLQAIPGQSRLSFEKLAKVCFVAYRQISRKICEALMGPRGIAGIHLAGYCPEQRQFRVFEFSTDRRTNTHLCEEILRQSRGFRFMGSGKRAAEKYIAETGCSAFQALQHVIDSKEDMGVGGPIQYGTYQGQEFRIYLQAELEDGQVRYPRAGLDLNAPEFSEEADDLFVSVSVLERGKVFPAAND